MTSPSHTGAAASQHPPWEHASQRGDRITFAADQPHSYINDSSEECWMYLVMNYGR